MKTYFDHEKLNAYQVSLAFNQWVGELLSSLEAKAAAKDQLDRAATSIPLNIAEGNGKFSLKDRARFSISPADQLWKRQRAWMFWLLASWPIRSKSFRPKSSSSRS